MPADANLVQSVDLDDFIRPAQSCILPVEVKKKPAAKVPAGGSSCSQAQVAKIQIGADGEVSEVYDNGAAAKLERVEVSLADCLACRCQQRILNLSTLVVVV